MLKPLNYGIPEGVSGQVLEKIAAIDPYNDTRIFQGAKPEHRQPSVNWDGNIDGQHYMFWLGFQFLESGEFIISIPDPTLRFDTVPGLREIREWEYMKLVEESNKGS